MSFKPENEARGVPRRAVSGGSASGSRHAPDGTPAEAATPTRERRGRPGLPARGISVLLVGLLVVALLVGALLLWQWYGDQAGGTSVFEESIPTGPEPVVRLANGAGQVRVEGVEGLENVEITAKRYARGPDPAAARENAADVAVNTSRDGSTLEISSAGGGTGVDYALRVPSGSRVEVESEAGDVEILGLADGVSARAASGDVTVRDVRGSVTVEAPAGDVAVEGVSTETGNVEVTAGSGDVSLTDLVVGVLETRVEAGDVELLGRFAGGGRVLVETGSIAVRVPPEDARELDLEARIGEVLRGDEGAGE